MDPVKRILSLSRGRAFLPILGVWIQIRAIRTKEMLESGLLPIANYKVSEMTEEEIEAAEKQVVENARNFLIANAVVPQVLPSGHPGVGVPGTVCIDDIPDDDAVSAYKQIVKLSDTRFYGLNHAAYNPEENARLYENQRLLAVMIDQICRRYGQSPREVENWDIDDLSRIMAYIDAGNAEDKKNEPKETRSTNTPRKPVPAGRHGPGGPGRH